MKKWYILLLLISCFTHFKLSANEVTVVGHVKFANGAGAGNIPVKIIVEVPCLVEHSVTTNNDGLYTNKIHCTSDIKKVRISVKNCDGQVLVLIKEVPASNVVEANFTICMSSITCVAKFAFSVMPVSDTKKYTVNFKSSGSETTSGDKIVERTWLFGDGTKMNGNAVDPVHHYEKPGTYEVCLIIKTDRGCSSRKCQVVEVKAGCKANFKWEHTLAGIRFNSNEAVGLPEDPIVDRSWNFGDGSLVLRGSKDPLHIFPKAGTYNVCLSLRTLKGCESKECKQVTVSQNPGIVCTARFSFERIGPKKFRFNSSLSTIGAEDRIVERQWDFRDGSPIVISNETSPAHEFKKPGIYEVCLKIKTAKGCESRFCAAIKVEEGAFTPEHKAIKIVSLYPAPVHNELKAIIFSKNNNVTATISLVDIYGQTKWSKQVILVHGNNPFVISTAALLPGPYFFRVTSPYGTQSQRISKL